MPDDEQPDPATVGADLDEVDDETAAALADELGDELEQRDDHPYDPAADPDAGDPVDEKGAGG